MIRAAVAALLLSAAFPALAQEAPSTAMAGKQPQASPATDVSNCPGPATPPGAADHAINTKGTGCNNGRAAGQQGVNGRHATAPANHAVNTKGTGATANGNEPVKK